MEMPCLETCLNLSDITPWEAVHKEVLLLWYSPVKAPEVWGNLLACANCWSQGSEDLVPALHALDMRGAAYVTGLGCCRCHTLEHIGMLLRLVPTVFCSPEPGAA